MERKYHRMRRGDAASRTVDVTQGVLWRQLLIFFFPILLGTFFQQLYNTADAIIVGRFVGKEALGAVGGATGVLLNVIINLFVGLSSGTTVIVAQRFGANRKDEVSSAVHTSIALALAGGIGLTMLGLLIAPSALRAIGTPEDVMPHALSYIRVCLIGVTPSFLYNMGAGVLRAVGNTRQPVLYLIIACLTNIVLDLLFVPLLGMGVAGAALATILSQALSATLVIVALRRSTECYRFTPQKMRFHRLDIQQVLKIGIPAGIQSNMYAIANILIQSCVNSFGTDTVAAWTAHSKADGFFWMILGAYGISVTTFAGQNFGARHYARVRESVKTGLILAAGTSIVLSVLYCAFARPILGMFTDDAAVLDIGVNIVFGMAPYYVTYVCVEILAGAIRGCGNALTPMIITAVGICLMRVIWIFAIVPLRPEMSTVLVSYPISWVITSLMFIIYYRRGRWMNYCINRAGAPESLGSAQ